VAVSLHPFVAEVLKERALLGSSSAEVAVVAADSLCSWCMACPSLNLQAAGQSAAEGPGRYCIEAEVQELGFGQEFAVPILSGAAVLLW
jgi:hypothetical protein